MEKIKINSIEMKGPTKTICVVGYYNPQLDIPSKMFEATLNTTWQSQEVDYLQNDVGLGGEVSVLIEQKGQYTNITKVDFDSAVPNDQVLKEVQNGVRSLNGQEQVDRAYVNAKPIRVDGTYCGNYNKDKSIIAQCLVKAMLGQCRTEYNIQDAVDMYKEALELLG